MAMHELKFDDYFRDPPARMKAGASSPATRLEIDLHTLHSLFTIAEILETSAGSEAAVRLAVLALRRALDGIECLPGGTGMS